MLQINDVIPLKWKLLLESDVLSITTTKMRARVLKEKRDSKCQRGKLFFIVECCQEAARGVPHHSQGFLSKEMLGGEPVRGFSSVVLRHS